MDVFRLAREKYAVPLSGKGAAQRGARWNSAGIELIYTAENRSLAMAEVAVHLTLATLPEDYVMLCIEIPDDIEIKTVSEESLAKNWRDFPHPDATQKIGNDFVLENKFCLMRIPSVVTPGDYNILINPRHADFEKINVKTMVKFPFDRRILK